MTEMYMQLGKEKISVPLEFNYEQFMRLRKYGEKKLTPVDLLSICTGVDIKQIKKADLKDIEKVSDVLAVYYFSGDSTQSEVSLTFEHNGVEYGLQTDMGKLSYGAWVDLEVYTSENIEEHIPRIMALLYYPITKKKKNNKYELEEYDDDKVDLRAEEFKTLPMKYWYGATTFFLLFAKTYIENIQSSLAMKNKYQKMMMLGLRVMPRFLQGRLLRASGLNVTKS